MITTLQVKLGNQYQIPILRIIAILVGSVHNIDFPHNGAYLCTEKELRSEVNFLANMDNILSEAEGYTNIDYYEKFMQQAQEEEKEKEEENV